jgi:hypothetical protein
VGYFYLAAIATELEQSSVKKLLRKDDVKKTDGWM